MLKVAEGRLAFDDACCILRHLMHLKALKRKENNNSIQSTI